MKKYFFILGSQPALSLAEIMTVLQINDFKLADQIAIFDLPNLEAYLAIAKLGGTVKIGEIIQEADDKGLTKSLQEVVYQAALARKKSKFNFGLSVYGHINLNYKHLAIGLKNSLKVKGIGSRWVKSEGKVLNSATAYHNRLTTESGIEVVVTKVDGKYLIGKTLALQPFIEYSDRDFGRPNRDSLSGMLPPKLAKMMLNLAKFAPEKTLLDPFCGSGTILTEALIMKAQQVRGSDISPKAITDTKQNIIWTDKKYNLNSEGVDLKVISADKISSWLKPSSVDCLATEPYLGPQRGKIEFNQVKQELEILYSKSLQEFQKILNPSGRIVMVWPVFNPEKNPVFLNPDLNGYNIIKFPELDRFPSITSRKTMLYGRPGQRLWREILVLEKK